MPRRLPPPALGRPASAGRRSSAALGLPRRSPGASPRLPSLGAVSRSPSPTPTTPPAAVCPALPPSFRLSRASDVCPCPLGAQLPVGAPSLRPRWWCGGKGARERGCGKGPPPAVGRGERTGSGGAGRTGVCEGWRGGERALPPSRGGRWGRSSGGGGGGGPSGRRSAGARRGVPPCGHGPAAPRPARGRGPGGRGGRGSTSGAVARGGVPCPSPASPFPGT